MRHPGGAHRLAVACRAKRHCCGRAGRCSLQPDVEVTGAFRETSRSPAATFVAVRWNTERAAWSRVQHFRPGRGPETGTAREHRGFPASGSSGARALARVTVRESGGRATMHRANCAESWPANRSLFAHKKRNRGVQELYGRLVSASEDRNRAAVIARLAEAAAHWRAQERALRIAAGERDAAILEAVAAGLSRREVAGLADVSTTRVQQLVDAAKARASR